jgi:hypothetical protein
LFGDVGGTPPRRDFSWGVDPANNQAWAVLNHNTDFAVIPEPSTMVIAGLGLAFFGYRRLRRQTANAAI